MGYPKDLLSTRAIIEHGKYAVIPPEGRVNNSIPNFKDSFISVIASPEMGAGFVQYKMDVEPGGGTVEPLDEEDIEVFVYCLSGKGTITIGDEQQLIEEEGYAYAPAHETIDIKNTSSENWELIVYKQKYKPLGEKKPWTIFANAKDLEFTPYDNMENVLIIDFLPTDPAFDFNFHILKFEEDGTHPFVETHVQEHGIYFLTGEGMYLIDDTWVPTKKDDFVWFGPYVPQAHYSVGRGNTSYIYSKDQNRDYTSKL